MMKQKQNVLFNIIFNMTRVMKLLQIKSLNRPFNVIISLIKESNTIVLSNNYKYYLTPFLEMDQLY